MKEFLRSVLEYLKVYVSYERVGAISKALLVALILAILSYLITRKLILPVVIKIVRKTKTKWDDYFIDRGVINNIAFLIPLITIQIFLEKQSFYSGAVEKGIKIGFIIVIIMIIQSILDGCEDIYNTFEISRKKPIKSYIQIINIIIIFMGLIIFLAILFNKSPLGLLSGIGAMTAIILLVFKDTLLGFVASIQLAANNLVSIGDWIEMQSQGADGYVTEINLTNVKVQNWDKTIVTIPSYSLVSQSFKNWKGMETSGGRRIKRNLFIDLHTVKFLEESDILKLKESKYLNKYFENKNNELEEENKDIKGTINERKLTNIGTFRIYIENYLKLNNLVDNKKPILVRQLQGNQFGVPLEIYCFASVISWEEYERIQCNIFDHLIAIIGEFDLAIYQSPSGNDVRKK